MGSTTVGFRLTSDVWTRYSAEAEAAGVPLATHLRRRLEQQDGVIAELASLRSVVERGPGGRTATSRELPLPPGGLLEVLLLLRVLAGPQKATIAQREVERRGLEVWR